MGQVGDEDHIFNSVRRRPLIPGREFQGGGGKLRGVGGVEHKQQLSVELWGTTDRDPHRKMYSHERKLGRTKSYEKGKPEKKKMKLVLVGGVYCLGSSGLWGVVGGLDLRLATRGEKLEKGRGRRKKNSSGAAIGWGGGGGGKKK